MTKTERKAARKEIIRLHTPRWTCAVCGQQFSTAQASSCYTENRCRPCHRAIVGPLPRMTA